MKPKDKSLNFVSYPASGWNWSVDVLGYALGKALLGRYDIAYDYSAPSLKHGEIRPFDLVCPADARAIKFTPLSEQLPDFDIDYCYHTHGYYGESPLWKLGQAKTIFVVRHPMTAIYSQYSKRRARYAQFEDFLKAEKVLERVTHFYNSWGDFVQSIPEEKRATHIYVVKYEDMREAPLNTFKALAKFSFDREIEDEIFIEALDYYSFEKQKERENKFSKDEKQHFHYKGQKSYKREISPDTYAELTAYFKKNLIHNFGYDF